ncbi:uncharacterized protein LOC106652162 isoform X1 [Trichogramma pretiosum]|uniref:uncharacterized protein LOC106652162 isoform X1 n=2 Tax=Trichogramma pretiosum TaxID=7493 RepID=UPI0006C9E4B2|nr:uncharacterized protein LOC106652162 isoform X1 [Trichogramma pretiosum]XP_023315042.1 uncharacterized protein LOC106652162 isoform X1 [Trichogramma pretiosum]
MSSLLNLAGPTFSSISNSEGKNIGNDTNSDTISKIISDIGVGTHPDTSAAEEVIQPGLVSIIIAIFLVFVLSLNTLACNSIILAAFYRYKRLRTASNCLLMSLAVSDFGVGLFMPFGAYLELSNLTSTVEPTSPSLPSRSSLCVIYYCIPVALCSVSVLMTVAIAIDRLTSLAQPLRYKNIITHSSIERYIAVFWIYAMAVGGSPIVYVEFSENSAAYSSNCRFNGVILPPVRVFLFLAVWAPSALILLGCYMYVYLVARAHARAIYTVELSFRNQTQTLAFPRYGQTLAVTVGAFFVFWLPFQTCMLLDIFCGTNILSSSIVWLSLPILAHSGTNPWLYAFHHGEMRIAAGKIAEDLVSMFGLMPSRYGCSPARRGSNTHLELAEVANSQDERRPPIEDCFAAAKQQHHHNLLYALTQPATTDRYPNAVIVNDISPESRRNGDSTSSDESGLECCHQQRDIVEKDIHDLAKMLEPKYVIDRNQHIIDSNHNIDKIKSLKYLLDPTFNKIRHLRKLNHKPFNAKSITCFRESGFVSYQNLKYDRNEDKSYERKKSLRSSAVSEPMLSYEDAAIEACFNFPASRASSRTNRRKASNLSSVSDSNLKDTEQSSSSDFALRQTLEHVVLKKPNSWWSSTAEQRQSRRSFTWSRARKRFSRARGSPQPVSSPDSSLDLKFKNTSYASLPMSDACSRSKALPRNFAYRTKIQSNAKSLDFRTQTAENVGPAKLLQPYKFDSLKVPTIHSEPPSPIEPIPLDSLKEEQLPQTLVHSQQPLKPDSNNQIRHSDPVIMPSVLLNVEDCSSDEATRKLDPDELSELLLERYDEERRFDTIFPEHDCSTRFGSRRPSDSRWSESSRSQEILSSSNAQSSERQHFPSSYSVNNFQSCAKMANESGSDLNDLTSCSCLVEPFICSEALSSSLRESFFSAPSVPDDSEDLFTSFETDDPTPTPEALPAPARGQSAIAGAIGTMRCSLSNLLAIKQQQLRQYDLIQQSKSTETMFHESDKSERLRGAFLRLEPSVGHGRPMVRPVVLAQRKDLRLAPLASPTPSEVCTPTFDMTVVADIKAEATGLGVRV